MLSRTYITLKTFITFRAERGDEENGAASNQNTENTKEVIYNFMEKELHIENARSTFEFQRVHRVRKAKGKKSRPIIARFLRFSNRQEVLSQARKMLKDKFIYSEVGTV